MDNFVIISGCSGGGKSTLLEALSKKGYATVPEPGRRIVKHETATGGTALPWVNMEAFARRAVAVSLADRDAAPDSKPVFFDRGLIDAASALHHICGDGFLHELKQKHRYNAMVFMTPPWPEIYLSDDERQHDFQAAVEEYERLLRDYRDLDYTTVILPKCSVEERVTLVLERLGATAS